MTIWFDATRKDNYTYVSDRAQKAMAGFIGEASKNIPLLNANTEPPQDLSERARDLINLLHISERCGGYAQKIFEHDLYSRLGLLRNKIHDFDKSGYTFSLRFVAESIALRSIGVAIAFLELEDLKLLSDLEKECISMTLNTELSDIQANNKIVDIQTDISEADYFSLLQLIKDSKSFRSLGDLRLFAQAGQDYKVVGLCDSGTGILDEKGKPLPKDRFPELFRGFSTQGGGLGLQLVYRLATLREGFVEVQTKRIGETEAITYNSKKGILIKEIDLIGKLPQEFSSGTCFSIYSPLNGEK